MLIGLLSDTHIDSSGQRLPPQIKDIFRDVDLILHAGDIWITSVLDELEDIAPILAARGDDDREVDIGGDSRVAARQTLSVKGLTLWVIHIKPRYEATNPSKRLHSSRPPVTKDPPDVMVYGHTHRAAIEHRNGVLLVNPGSPTVPHYVPRLGTVALLNIESGKAEARIVQLE